MAGHSRLPLNQWDRPIELDKGTLNLGRTPTPGPTGLAKGIVDYIGAFTYGDISEEEFRTWAVGYANAVAHTSMRAYSWGAPLVSSLSDDMLRMYLRGRSPDPDVIRRVGEEIRTSPQFEYITLPVEMEVDRMTRSLGRALMETELLAAARHVVHGLMHREGGFEFGAALQKVIGGVSRMEVSEVSIQGNRYTIRVLIGDTYDFDNDRSDDPEYDMFRRRLYRLIRERSYYSFMLAMAEGNLRGSTDGSALFASFMYAIERAGYTPGGVRWDVTVPFEREFNIPAQSSTAARH